jgi:hypothetical protein
MRERAVALGEGGDDLTDDRTAATPGRSRMRLRPATVGVAAAAACASAVIAGIVIGGDSGGPGTERAYAAEAVRVAEANPRLLVGAPGWTVSRADEFELDQGSMDFTNGESTLTLTWRRLLADEPPIAHTGPDAYLPELDQWYWLRGLGCGLATAEREPAECAVYQRNTETEVLEETAILEEHRSILPEREMTSFFVYLPARDRVEVDLYTSSMSRDELAAVLSSLEPTDVDTWLSALPPRIVQPLERPEIVDEMLAGVPVHPSVDVDALKDEFAASSRYQLGADVTRAVACAWLDQWAAALRSGDAVAAEEATRAMSTSRDWAILREMEDQGGWSQVIWEYADEMRRDERDALLGSAGTTHRPDGQAFEDRPAYAWGIGCDSARQVPLEGGGGFQPLAMPKPIPVEAPGAQP